MMKLHEIAHSRSGDKGDISNISVIAYEASHYALLCERLTTALVAEQFRAVAAGPVKRYELPRIAALNFVIEGALAGGVTRALTLDAHGKSLSSLMLEIEI